MVLDKAYLTSATKHHQLVDVPGLGAEPSQITKGGLQYAVPFSNLYGVEWGKMFLSHATVMLYGARFDPSVNLHGEEIAAMVGGMAPMSFTFSLYSKNRPPTLAKDTLTINLKGLDEIGPENASYIPKADQWRSNISSGLWDKLSIRYHGPMYLERYYTSYDPEHDAIKFHIWVEGQTYKKRQISFQATVANKHIYTFLIEGPGGYEFSIARPKDVALWSPDMPSLYDLSFRLNQGKSILDAIAFQAGFKSFKVEGKHFLLNNAPFTARGGTVVWHRFLRDKEGREVAWDTAWFVANVIKPLKERGANFLRFHLGTPPQSLLALCDRYGLLTQYEYFFFHGLPATAASLEPQWRFWLDAAMQHPSTGIIHPWNETNEEDLLIAHQVLDSLLLEYPPLVVSERDVLHLHKYWYSLFENLGLYYDSAAQFPKPIMADEFGGNYLDGNADPGTYKTLGEAMQRWLGRHQTREERLAFHTVTNAKVAEYWRGIGAAGLSPFCIAGSYEDGNHWYLGPLKDGKLKPVWNALTPAWSPIAASLSYWDKNHIPKQKVEIPFTVYNETPNQELILVELRLVDATKRKIVWRKTTSYKLWSHERQKQVSMVEMPANPGKYLLEAEVVNRPIYIKHPIISSLEIEVIDIKKQRASLKPILLVAGMDEYQKGLESVGYKTNLFDNSLATTAIVSFPTKRFCHSVEQRKKWEAWLDAGKSIIVLDAGPQWLGAENDAPNTMQTNGLVQPKAFRADSITLPFGAKITFFLF